MSAEEDISNLSLRDRLSHKSWKARVSGYQELLQQFIPKMATEQLTSSPESQDNANSIPHWSIEAITKIPKDSNVVAQQEGLKAVLCFIETFPSQAMSIRTALISGLVDKSCLGSTKINTRQLSIECLLAISDLEAPDLIVEEIMDQFYKPKQPIKFVIACAFTVKEMARLYGTNPGGGHLNLKPIVKRGFLQAAFSHADSNVRNEAHELTISIFQWAGRKVIDGVLKEIKPVQLKQLETDFETLKHEPKPSQLRLLNSQKSSEARVVDDEHNKSESTDVTNDQEPQIEEDADPYDLADPMDIISKLPSDFYDKLASSKWKERKEALDNLLGKLNDSKNITLKLSDGNYHQLISTLCKKVGDVNINCAILAVTCISQIISGLRDRFSAYKPVCMAPLLSKSKEKKPSIIQPLSECLDKIFELVCRREFTDLIQENSGSDPILEALHSKYPQVKVNTSQYLKRCIASIRVSPAKSIVKVIAGGLVKLVDDSDPSVRESGMESMGYLLRSCDSGTSILGEKLIGAYLDGIDPLKVQKVREFYEKAELSIKGLSAKSEKTTTAGKPELKKSTSRLPNSTSGPAKLNLSKKPRLQLSKKKDNQSSDVKSSKTKKEKSDAQSKTSTVGKSNAPCFSSDEEAFNIASEIFAEVPNGESDLLSKLSDKSWKVRFEGMDWLTEFIKSTLSGAESSGNSKLVSIITDGSFPELILRMLNFKIGKDSNFQVMQKYFGMAKIFADSEDPRFIITKSASFIVLPIMIEKIGDIKLRKSSLEAIGSIMEAIGSGYALNEWHSTLKTQKSPKILAEAIKSFKDFMYDFGITQELDFKGTIDLCKTHVANSNPQVRSAAVSLLGLLRLFKGADIIRKLVSDVGQAQMGLIEAEFEKMASAPVPEPSRFKRVTSSIEQKSAIISSGTQSEREHEEPAKDDLEDLLPRIDLMSMLSAEIVENICDSNWKTRKEALDSVDSALKKANERIKPEVEDLLSALKNRFSDSNKNLVIFSLEITGRVIKSGGKKIEKYVAPIISDVLVCANDNKAQVRASCINCLNNALESVSSESFVIPLSSVLPKTGPNGKKELLQWFSKQRNMFSKASVLDAIKAIAICLQDRSSEVRKAAQEATKALVEICGHSVVCQKISQINLDSNSRALVDSFKNLSLNEKENIGSKPTQPTCKTPVKKAPGAGTPKTNRKLDTTTKSFSPAPANSLNRSLSTAKKRSNLANPQKTPEETPLKNFPLISDDLKVKDKRAQQDRGHNKWAFDSPRAENIDFLKDQMKGNVDQNFMNLLFAEDQRKDKKILSALTILAETFSDLDNASSEYDIPLSSIKDRIIANSDLLFKYLSLRLFENNTSSLLKCFDILDYVIDLVDSNGSTLTDYEVRCFFPHLIRKVGDNKETIRTRVKSIFKKICRVFPASKVSGFLLNGLSSKNSRTRSECLDEIGILIKHHGTSIFHINRDISVILSHASDRDSNVRNAALNTIVDAYLCSSDQVSKYLDSLNPKERTMFDEKIKRIGSHSSNKTTSNPIQTDATAINPEKPSSKSENEKVVSESTVKTFSLDLENVEMPKLSSNCISVDSKADSVKPETEATSRNPSQPNHSEYFMDYLQSQITSGDVNQSIDALKNLEKLILNKPDSLVPHVNSMVNAITLQVRLAFTSPAWSTDGDLSSLIRLCKHLINSLVQLFSNEGLSTCIDRETLHPLLSEILARLVDPIQGSADKDIITQLTRALNVLMLRILDKCDKNLLFRTLLDLLYSSIEDVDRSHEQANTIKFSELVMKCLWKLTKSLKKTVEEERIDLSFLIMDVNNFFTYSPPAVWKKRAQEKKPLGDMPLRTAKTILHEIAGSKGSAVLRLFIDSLVDFKGSPVHNYLLSMVQNLSSSQKESETPAPISMNSSKESLGIAPTESRNISSENRAHPNEDAKLGIGLSNSGALTESEADLALDSILSKISSKDDTKIGISELFHFQHDYPQYQDKVDSRLQEYGVNFRIYIRKCLSKMAEQSNNKISSDKSPNTGSSSSSGSESRNYKERLARIQEMLGYSDSKSTSNSTSQTVNKQEGPRNLDSSSESASSSVIALKERLARMRSSMASIPSQNSN